MLNKPKLQPITNYLKSNKWNFYQHQLELLKYLDKKFDVLLIAPTGSGKTLAGFLPSINNLLNNKNNKRLNTIYISPLKALTKDVYRNLLKPLEFSNTNITVGIRTGDTTPYQKKKQLLTPPNMLMTTPESFALLMSETKAEKFFENIEYIIIDEIHSIVNSKRGDLLSLNLARLKKLSKNCNLIGLSATIKKPNEIMNYLSNSKSKKIINVKNLIKPKVKILEFENRIPWSGHMATYAIKEIYNHISKVKQTIIFVNTRAQSEVIFQNLWKENDKNLKIAIHHGSLDYQLRKKVERKMSLGILDCVIATSSLDLGIDWGDVKLVIQVGSPKGISRLLQRIGRSNHNLNIPSKAILVPTNRFEYVECVAAIKSINENLLDQKSEKKGSLDVLAQHILGVACSSPFNTDDLYNNIIEAWPYRKLSKSDFEAVIKFVKNGGYSLERYDRFSKISLNKNNQYMINSDKIRTSYKMNIGTIIESHMLQVRLGKKTLGNIEEWFIENLSTGDTFIFGGQILKFEKVIENIVHTKKTKDKSPMIPSYAGGRLPLSTELADQVINVLNDPGIWSKFPVQISEWIKLQKQESIIPNNNKYLVESFPKKIRKRLRYFLIIYTFEGRDVNQTLGFLISRRLNRLKLKPLGFVATDYALAIWSIEKIDNINEFFSEELMMFDLFEWLEETPLMKKKFRDVAIISGLIERQIYGKIKTSRQVMFSTDLIYEVLKKHEPDHILLKAAKNDAMSGLISLERLGNFLKKIENNLTFKTLNSPSPMSIPLIFEISKETIESEKVKSFYFDELEKEIYDKFGLT